MAETQGNPLALLELPRGLSPAQLAGGFGLTGAQAVPGRIEESFRRRRALPADTRLLLLVAAAEPVGDAVLVRRAAERLGIAASAAAAAEADGLVEIGTRVRFRHPLVRSAVYRSAALPDRRAAHLALAEVTDRDLDPDRRAWHLAAAAAGPDEQVAAELERSAGRAQARGGLAAAAAFLQRAVALTAEPGPRAGRALAAAHASLQAGAFDAALELVATAEAGPLDDLQRAQVSLLRGQVAFAAGAVGEAPALLLRAARQLEPLDGVLARQTYLDAWTAAAFAGRFAQDGNLHEVSRAARSRLRPRTLRLPAICCWTAWPSWSPTDAPRRHRCCGGWHASSPRTRSRPRRDCAGAGWPRQARPCCGTWRTRSRFSSGSSSPPVRRACSSTF